MCGPSPNEDQHACWLFDLQEGVIKLSDLFHRQLFVDEKGRGLNTLHALIALHLSEKYKQTITEQDVHDAAPEFYIDRLRNGTRDGFVYRSEFDFHVRWKARKPFDDAPTATNDQDKWELRDAELRRSLFDPDQKNADMIQLGWRGEQYDGGSDW